MNCSVLLQSSLWILVAVGPAFAQPAFVPPPAFDSVEIAADGSITLRLHAPNAERVALSSSDMPGAGFQGFAMTKGEDGVWECTVGPVPGGSYRYVFNVDGLSVIDPRNPVTSESNMSSSSLLHVPGLEFAELKAVPHGNISNVYYHSETLSRSRRMHVYTPPGYERGEGRYPVLYLLHGATDGDNSWSTVGRAGVILDNLIAAGKAKPMIVVMPHGHTGPFVFGGRLNADFERQMQEFQKDFTDDIRPHVEANYRTINERGSRAIAGLSMGGAQTLNIAFENLQDYGYVGVFSSGIFGIAGGFGGDAPSTDWEDSHLATLDDASLKEGLRVFWIACGREDFLVRTSEATVEMFEKHQFKVEERQTEGGHTWIKWRDYLHEFAPLLFKEGTL